jgi:ABC-type dipeptide/oligopeptide/nickel transport system permease subunit
MSSPKSGWRELVARVLDPRSRLDRVPSMATSMAQAMGAEEIEMPAYTKGGSVIGRKLQWRAIAGNLPLIAGGLIILVLFVLVLFGPLWAPQNPYIAGQHIVPHFDRETGEFIQPPLSPSADYPLGTDEWGTDILSMLMHGARNTLVAGAFITMLRVILGVILGAMAGWNEGKWSDRFVMGLIGMLTALPLLISTIILIYALDIRRGLAVFIVALSVIGWTEIAQYIRSEFLILRKMPYIEGARATGLTGLQMAVRHVLPNVLPQLLVITFLEMGAVLMLLGELGFVGVYIGGGSRIDLTEPLGPTRIFTLADVPEWGAMIADGYKWLRSAPFVVFWPALAFFVAVVGFNLLGEGLRRLIEHQGLKTGFLLRKRMLLVVAGLTFAAVFIMNNTGAAPWFAKVAQSFSSDRVMEHLVALTAMEGRAIGQPGGEAAADYVAAKFEEYGLEAGWRQGRYTYEVANQLVYPVSRPELILLDENGRPLQHFQHQVDFGYVTEGHGGSGLAAAPISLIGFYDRESEWQSYKGLDLQGRIVLLVEGNAPADFATEALIRGASGILWVAGDGQDDVRSQAQLVGDPNNYLRQPTRPTFRIRPRVAEAILAEVRLANSSQSITEIFAANEPAAGSGPGWFVHDVPVQVSMALSLGEPQVVQVPSVIGYIPGSDLDLGNEMVVLFATYDGLGSESDGQVYQGANDNASGVAMLLELARLWQEQGLDARRTTMFVAWGGGELDESGARAWLESAFNFRHVRTQGTRSNVSPEFLLQLDRVGRGDGGLVVRTRPSAERLAELIEETCREIGITLANESQGQLVSGRIAAPSMTQWAWFGWAGSDVPPTEDVLDTIEQEKLQLFGEMFALLMTKLVRETSY